MTTPISKIAMKLMVKMGEKSLDKMEANSKHPEEVNLDLLKTIIKDNKGCEYGRLHNFADIKSYEDFVANVPLNTYDNFEPYIKRIVAGEENLIYSAKTLGFSRTSGSSGVPKYIPATQKSLDAYVDYTWTRSLALGVRELRAQGKSYKSGRGWYTDPATNVRMDNGMLCSNIAEIGSTQYAKFFKYILAVPKGELFDENTDYSYLYFRFGLEDEDLSFTFSVFFSETVTLLNYLQENWKWIVDDIEKGTISDRAKLDPAYREELKSYVKPNPKRAAYLREELAKGFDKTFFKRIWPNLSSISGIGTCSFAPAAEKIRNLAEGIPMDFSIYGSSEGLLAACYKLDCTDMQLLVDSVFFEFIPEDDPTETPITVGHLKKNGLYEIVITTHSGLYRYRTKDVVEIVDFRNKCPLIAFKYRKGTLINVAGEKFSEEDSQVTIREIEKRYGKQINHWILTLDTTGEVERYMFIFECDEGEDLTDMVPQIEEIMGESNERYPWIRGRGDIGPLKIVMQKPGTHAEWRQGRIDAGAPPVQVKPVHALDNDFKKDFFLSRLL